MKRLLIVHGHAEFMVQTIKMTNLRWEDYLKMVELIYNLQSEKIFPPTLCTKIFEIVLSKMEKHWKDEFTLSLILLKKFRKNMVCAIQDNNWKTVL